MKKTCETFGSDGKGKGRAGKVDAVGEALKDYLSGKNPVAWNFAYSLCRDAEEAGELVQEACYRLLKAQRSYEAPKPVKSWLLTILRNVFRDSRRSWDRRSRVSLDWEGGEDGECSLHETLAGREESAEKRLERDETAARIRLALSRLSRKDRQVLRLCDIRRLRYESVAERLGVATGTVRSRLHRARQRLRHSAARLGVE